MTDEQAALFMADHSKQPVRARLAQIIKGQSVLDLGCGKGDEVCNLYTPPQYMGVDCSPALIRIARKQNPGYKFCEGDVRSAIPRYNYEWDYAVLKSVLEHLPEDEAVAVYQHARSLCNTLLVVWHMEPLFDRGVYKKYHGELGVMQQNRHCRNIFEGQVHREVCDKHVIWTVRG